MSNTEDLLAEHRQWLRKFHQDVGLINRPSHRDVDLNALGSSGPVKMDDLTTLPRANITEVSSLYPL